MYNNEYNTMEYIRNADTIIFGPNFNKILKPYTDLFMVYKKLLFIDYELNMDLFDKYLDKKYKYIDSKFNQDVSNLIKMCRIYHTL